MTLEELIYQRFANSEQLTRYLATYAGLPAVFNPDAPDDKQKGWDGQSHYPRIVYNFEMQADMERKSAGTLAVSLICRNDADVVPERIEPEVRKCLRDVLLKTDDNTLYAFSWARTDAFTMAEDTNELLIGSEVRFDIIEYTCQETTDPDPIVAMNQYLKELYPDSIVIGLDRMQNVTVASKECPVFYCKLTQIDREEETNNVVWMNGRISISTLCPDSSVRLKMATAVANSLALDGEVIMLDKSPMFIERLSANFKSDYLKDGQVFPSVRYGLLRYKAKPHGLRHPNIEY